MLKDIFKTLKVNHYIKNVIVIMPLLFSMSFTNPILWAKCFVIFLSFCLISSAVYVMNDIIDIEKDKLHPIKCKRPIASGKISKKLAYGLMFLLIILACACAFVLNIHCLIVVLSYFVLNIFYSLRLKQVALIDVACIALGFVLRIVSGCAAISVIPSALVILLTFFASMFFTFSKRKLEIQLAKDERRESIKEFNIDIANQFILINAILSIAFYFTYVLDEATIARAGSEYLYVTVIPFTLMAFRLLLLVNLSSAENDDPIHFIENDKPLKLIFGLYILTLILVLTVLK